MWQDFVFLAGSVFSILVLAPTLRNSVATVPIGTSVPSACLGLVYGGAFLSMDMTFSAAGSLLTGVIWGFIAALRSPHRDDSTPGHSTARSEPDATFAD